MRIQWRSILTLMLVPVLAGSSAYAASTHTSSRAPMTVSEEIPHQLRMLPRYGVFDWLECEIRPDNTAVLRGQVTRPVVRSDAEGALHRIDGITKIENQIEVLPLSTGDDQLRITIYRSLFRYDSPMFRYALQAAPSIHIIVNSGRVTLKGIVDNAGDSQIANSVANGTSGVLQVTNELEVAGKS